MRRLFSRVGVCLLIAAFGIGGTVPVVASGHPATHASAAKKKHHKKHHKKKHHKKKHHKKKHHKKCKKKGKGKYKVPKKCKKK